MEIKQYTPKTSKSKKKQEEKFRKCFEVNENKNTATRIYETQLKQCLEKNLYL